MGIFSWSRKRKMLLLAMIAISTMYSKMLVSCINNNLPKNMKQQHLIVQMEKKYVEQAQDRGDLKTAKQEGQTLINDVESTCSANACSVKIDNAPPFVDDLIGLQNSFQELYDKKITVDDFVKKAEAFRKRYSQYGDAVKEVDLLIRDAKQISQL